jgi:hypothetical protein
MPIYEYRCEQCGHLVDLIQKRTTRRRKPARVRRLDEEALALGTIQRISFTSPLLRQGQDRTSDTGAPESKTAKESALRLNRRQEGCQESDGGAARLQPASGGDSRPDRRIRRTWAAEDRRIISTK